MACKREKEEGGALYRGVREAEASGIGTRRFKQQKRIMLNTHEQNMKTEEKWKKTRGQRAKRRMELCVNGYLQLLYRNEEEAQESRLMTLGRKDADTWDRLADREDGCLGVASKCRKGQNKGDYRNNTSRGVNIPLSSTEALAAMYPDISRGLQTGHHRG
jgi:hypothetical protein